MGYKPTPYGERLLNQADMLEEKLGGISPETFRRLGLHRLPEFRTINIGGAKYSERLIDQFIRESYEKAEGQTAQAQEPPEVSPGALRPIRPTAYPDPLPDEVNQAPTQFSDIVAIRRRPGRPKRVDNA